MDNNFSNYNLFMYCGNNPVSRIDSNGENWYYLWLDDLIRRVEEMAACVSNIIYARDAYAMSFYNPQGARKLWNSRPFSYLNPSLEMQMFTGFVYDLDFVIDISVSIDIPIVNNSAKTGVSKVFSASEEVNNTYAHVGVVLSTPSVFPITFSFSVGIVDGIKDIKSYIGSSFNSGISGIYGLERSWSFDKTVNAYSFTIGNSYGVYGGYDFYWCID